MSSNNNQSLTPQSDDGNQQFDHYPLSRQHWHPRVVGVSQYSDRGCAFTPMMFRAMRDMDGNRPIADRGNPRPHAFVIFVHVVTSLMQSFHVGEIRTLEILSRESEAPITMDTLTRHQTADSSRVELMVAFDAMFDVHGVLWYVAVNTIVTADVTPLIEDFDAGLTIESVMQANPSYAHAYRDAVNCDTNYTDIPHTLFAVEVDTVFMVRPSDDDDTTRYYLRLDDIHAGSRGDAEIVDFEYTMILEPTGLGLYTC